MKKVRFCPKCGSKDIEDIYFALYFIAAIGRKRCRKCGYKECFFQNVMKKIIRK
ncbi:MAG: hypothetical protein KKF53_01720 [Nanoarchaeota archaeon]|nr:hypothetical protein [Nanoarchaeota archaeon]